MEAVSAARRVRGNGKVAELAAQCLSDASPKTPKGRRITQVIATEAPPKRILRGRRPAARVIEPAQETVPVARKTKAAAKPVKVAPSSKPATVAKPKKLSLAKAESLPEGDLFSTLEAPAPQKARQKRAKVSEVVAKPEPKARAVRRNASAKSKDAVKATVGKTHRPLYAHKLYFKSNTRQIGSVRKWLLDRAADGSKGRLYGYKHANGNKYAHFVLLDTLTAADQASLAAKGWQWSKVAVKRTERVNNGKLTSAQRLALTDLLKKTEQEFRAAL